MPRALPPRDAKGRFCQRPTGEALPEGYESLVSRVTLTVMSRPEHCLELPKVLQAFDHREVP